MKHSNSNSADSVMLGTELEQSCLSLIPNAKIPETALDVDVNNELPDGHAHKRKRKVSQISMVLCPVCGISVRTLELGSHYTAEVTKLDQLNTRKSVDQKIKKLSSKAQEKKKSRHSLDEDHRENVTGKEFIDKETSSERLMRFREIQRKRYHRQAKALLLDKIHQRRASTNNGQSSTVSSSCPICGKTFTGDAWNLNSHVEKCIAKSDGQDEASDSSGEETDTFDEYTWAGQTRVRVTPLLESGLSSLEGKTVKLSMTDENEELNIDDEDYHPYGPIQYSEKDVIPCPADEPDEKMAREKIRAAMLGNEDEKIASAGSRWSNEASVDDILVNGEDSKNSGDEHERGVDPTKLIQSIQSKVSKLEQICSDQPKCLICMESYLVPLVSVLCWHVHCEECWLRTLGAKKLCPQCNVITSPSDLRKIYI